MNAQNFSDLTSYIVDSVSRNGVYVQLLPPFMTDGMSDSDRNKLKFLLRLSGIDTITIKYGSPSYSADMYIPVAIPDSSRQELIKIITERLSNAYLDKSTVSARKETISSSVEKHFKEILDKLMPLIPDFFLSIFSDDELIKLIIEAILE